MERRRSCAFTGHRPDKMPFGYDEADPRCVLFRKKIQETIEGLIGEGYDYFLSGGAQGFDTFAAEAVLALREKYPWIRLEMVIPFEAQAGRWTAAYRARHDKLLEMADKVTYTARLWFRGAMFRRNRYLVDNADILLAYYEGLPGGTRMTVAYALEKGIEIRKIHTGEEQE